MLYPTYVPGHMDEFSAAQQQWEGAEIDPWEDDYHENDVVSGVD